ncbi:MAG TPA: hypothetical protein VN643_10620 [Pyrinomonadaceae bacterium]|nr:hypothetical protein [Pyrinomonadaceae bacterium]
MNFKSLVIGILLTLVLGAGLPAAATTLIAAFQEPQTQGSQGPGNIGLTTDQKSKMKSIHESTRDQMRALRSDTSLTPEQRHEKARSIREATRQQVMSVLTPQQQQKLREHRRGGERGSRERRHPCLHTFVSTTFDF